MFKLIFLFILFTIAQVINDPLVQQIITILTPVLVFASTWLVQKLKALSGLPGVLVVTLLVPLCSLFITLLTNWLNLSTLEWWQSLIYGLLAVLISQIQIQWNKWKETKNTL